MKNWMIALTIVSMLGFTGLANAKDKSKTGHGGMHGKITAVTDTSFTMTVGGKKNPHSVTVTLAAGATVMIDGVAGKITSDLVGKKASVTGPENAGAVSASAVTVSTKHHEKKNKAA